MARPGIYNFHYPENLLPGNPRHRGTGHQIALDSKQQSIRILVGLMRIERISQPGKVDVQAAQGRQPALIIVDGHRIRGIGKGVRPVKIRVCPGGPQVIQGPEEFRILAIIVLRRA